MKFGVGITMYNPNKEVWEYLNSLTVFFSAIYIYDNTKSNDAYLEYIDKTFVYSHTGENRGLSKGFNWFLDKANLDKLDYLLILDQDSCYDVKKLQKLMNEIEKFGIDDKVAIRACNAKPQNTTDVELPSEIVNTIDKVISSGSFLCMNVINKNELRYDENLFVDYVDDDFCKSIHAKNLEIVCHNRYVMPQQLGYLYKGRICHSPIRHYYILRDLGYMNRKYYSKFVVWLKTTFCLMKTIKSACFEDNTWSKIKYSVKGYIDFMKKKTGEYN